MKNKQSTPTTRVRLYSHVTKTRFLHVEDALNIGKVRLFAGTYRRGQGMSSHTSHYLDLSDARIVFHALLFGEQGFDYKEYKGSPPLSAKQPADSRVLSVVVKSSNVYIELKSGPGRLMPTGAITPNGRPQTEVNVSFKLHEARRLAAEVLAYIHAWDVCRMLTFEQVVGKPLAYRLSSSAGEPDEPRSTSGSVHDEEDSIVTTHANRPVTYKGGRPETNGAVAKKAICSPITPGTGVDASKLSNRLRYGNGVVLDSNNVLEFQTFQRYLTENGQAPATKAILQTYYRQQMAA